MTQSPYEEKALPGTDALRAKLAQVLAAPLPETKEARLALLESHLRDSLATRGDAPPADFSAAPDDLSRVIGAVRAIATDVAEKTMPSTTFDFSPCDMAVIEGVGLITFGSVLGPQFALAGFGIGVYLLTQNCGEGS